MLTAKDSWIDSVVKAKKCKKSVETVRILERILTGKGKIIKLELFSQFRP